MVKYTKTEVMRALKDYSKRGQKWARLLLPILNKEFADKKTDDARNWAIRLSQSIVKSRLPVLKLTVDKMEHEDFIKALKKIERRADLYADWWVDVEETEFETDFEVKRDNIGRMYTIKSKTVSGWNGAIYYQPLPNKLEDSNNAESGQSL